MLNMAVRAVFCNIVLAHLGNFFVRESAGASVLDGVHLPFKGFLAYLVVAALRHNSIILLTLIMHPLLPCHNRHDTGSNDGNGSCFGIE